MGDVIAAWNMTGETSGKEYVAASFEHPNISARKVYYSLGQSRQAQGRER